MNKILIIEDSRVAQALLHEILQHEYQLDVHADGIAGIAAARENPPDLILLDINMPGMNGYEVCTALKRDEKTRDIPIIFITSLDSETEKVRGFETGADDYVVKPFYRQELMARVKAHLSVRNSKLQALRLERLTVFKEMAVAISHEINNPLTTVYAFLHILQNDLPEASESTKMALSGIRKEITRIHEITSKLADSSKAKTVKYSKDINMIDLHDL